MCRENTTRLYFNNMWHAEVGWMVTWFRRMEKAKTRLSADGRRHTGANKKLSNFNTTSEKLKTLESPGTSEFRMKVELKSKELIDTLIKEWLDPKVSFPNLYSQTTTSITAAEVVKFYSLEKEIQGDCKTIGLKMEGFIKRLNTEP